jgi:hypothetical protein
MAIIALLRLADYSKCRETGFRISEGANGTFDPSTYDGASAPVLQEDDPSVATPRAGVAISADEISRSNKRI